MDHGSQAVVRHKGGAEHERVARAKQKPTIPAAIVLGGDPASMWCASAPLPPNIDEYLLAGWLRGKPVEFVECVSVPLEVPAQAEIVIEGYVDPNEHLPEGPFGDHTGYYTPVEPLPVFHVTAITRRKEAIYPTTVVGIPPMEDAWMGKATERLFLPLMRLFLPEIVDVHMPPAGGFHNLVLVSIRKRYPGQARKVVHGLWGLGLMMLAKAIVVFDEWVDVQNLGDDLSPSVKKVKPAVFHQEVAPFPLGQGLVQEIQLAAVIELTIGGVNPAKSAPDKGGAGELAK